MEVDIDAPAVRAGDTVTLGIRPEHFTVVDGGEPGRSALHGRVQLVEHLGDVAYVHALAAGGETLTARLPHDTPLRAGAAVQFAFLPGEALVFDAGGKRCGSLSPIGLECPLGPLVAEERAGQGRAGRCNWRPFERTMIFA